MDVFWKVALIAAALIGLFATWEIRSLDQARKRQVTQLSRLLDPAEFEPRTAPEVAQGNFFKTLALLRTRRESEPRRMIVPAGPKEVDWYLHQALDSYSPNDSTRRLIIDAVHEALSDCENAGVFDDTANLAGMSDGRAPVAVSGPFAGERLRVSYRISPLSAAEVHNHPANFKLLPLTAWSLHNDRLDQTAISAAHDFRDARLLAPGTMDRMELAWKKAQKNN